MNVRTRVLELTLVLTLARAAFAGTPGQADFTASAVPLASCFNGNGSTFQVKGLAMNVSGATLTAFQMGFCVPAGVSIFQPVPGSANRPGGGTSQNQTCPTLGGAGILFTASGPWPNNGQNTVTVDMAVSPSFSGASIPIEVTASDGTHTPASATAGLPTCTTSPGLHISKTAPPDVRADAIFDFTITVTNTSAVPSPAYEVNDSVPGLPIQGVSSNCELLGTLVNCAGPSLPGGGTATYKVTCKASGFGTQTNTAVLSGDGIPTQQASASIELEPLRFGEVRIPAPGLVELTGRP